LSIITPTVDISATHRSHCISSLWTPGSGENHEEEREKVLWVRQTLQRNKTRANARMFSDGTKERKIVEEGVMAPLLGNELVAISFASVFINKYAAVFVTLL